MQKYKLRKKQRIKTKGAGFKSATLQFGDGVCHLIAKGSGENY